MTLLLAWYLPAGASESPLQTRQQPRSEAERFEVLREHYRIYAESFFPHEPALHVELRDLVETLPSGYHDVDPRDILSLAPGGRIAIQRQVERRGTKRRVTAIPFWQPHSADDLASWSRRLEHAPADVGTLSDLLVDILAEDEGKIVAPEAIDAYRVSFVFGEHAGAYDAFAIWLRDEITNELIVHIMDQTLTRIATLRSWIEDEPGIELEPIDAPSSTPGLLADRDSVAEAEQCVQFNKTYLFPNLAEGEEYYTNGDLYLTGERGAFCYPDGDGLEVCEQAIVKTDQQDHQTDSFYLPGHHLLAAMDLTCSCTENCRQIAATRIHSQQMIDVGEQIHGCHDISAARIDDGLTEGPNGNGIFAVGGVGGAWKRCRDLRLGCYCGDISVEVTSPEQIPGSPIPNLGVTVTSSADAIPMELAIGAWCAPCQRAFDVHGSVSDLDGGAQFNATVFVSDSPQGTATSTYFFDRDTHGDQFETEKPVADGQHVRMEVVATDTAGQIFDCGSDSGRVDGGPLSLDVSCGCIESGNCSPPEAHEASFTIDTETYHGLPAQGDVVVALDVTLADGTLLPSQRVVADASSSGTHVFPELVEDGATYSMYVYRAADKMDCHVYGGGTGIATAPIVAEVGCAVGPDYWCTVMPELCGSTSECNRTLVYDGSTVVIVTDPQDPDWALQITVHIFRFETVCTEDAPRVADGASSRFGPWIYLRTATVNPWKGQIEVSGVARHDQEGVAWVEAFVDGQPVDLGTVRINQPDPYTCSEWPTPDCNANSGFSGVLDTRTLTDGQHTLTIASMNGSGTVGGVNSIDFQVDNSVDPCALDGSGPSLSFSPADGAVLGTEPVTISASVSDPSAVSRVAFRIDGQRVALFTEGPYTYRWTPTPGSHALKVRAVDGCGNVTAEVHSVTVTESSACAADTAVDHVALTAPAAGSVFEPGQGVALSANASDASGVDRVQFFADGALVGTDHAAPFGVTWSAASGTTELVARAFDRCGNDASDRRTISVTDGCDAQVDHVDLTTPTAGAVLVEGQTVTLAATATDADGIDRVQFLRNGVVVAEDGSPPFSVTWAAQLGTTQLTARAVDGCGNAREDHHAVTVTPSCGTEVDAVALTSPAQGASLDEGQPVTLTATASDGDGIEKVQFLRGDGSLIGADTTAPYALSWSPEVGVDQIKARAFDHCGNFRADTHDITVVPACDTEVDVVMLTSPAQGASLDEGQPVTLTATASDGDGIEKVQFLRGDGSLIGADTTAPYALSWSPEVGVDQIKARAFDHCGNFRADPHDITVAPACDATVDSVLLTHPAHGATLAAGSSITLTATASDAQGIEKVQFVRSDGTLIGVDFTPPFTLQWTVESGVTWLKARAWDHCGNFSAARHDIRVR